MDPLMKLVVKAATISWEFLLAAINPRELDDLEPEELMPAIQKTNGVITNALLVWVVPDDHPIWNSVRNVLTNEPVDVPKEERHKYRIIIRGHRRGHCIATIATNPHIYSADMVKNAAKVPVREISCSQEDAEELAMDFEEIRNLHSWNTLKIVFKEYAKDLTYQEVALKYPQMLYSAFLGNGQAKYDKMIRDPKNVDGTERQRQIKMDLRNVLDNHFYSLHLFGQDAMVEQGLLYFRYFVNGLLDKSEGKKESERLVLDLKYGNVSALRRLYTEIRKKGDLWTPITKVAIVDAKPEDGPDINYRSAPGVVDAMKGRFLVVEGGTEEFREALLLNMATKIDPGVTDKPAKPPTQKEREAIIGATGSGLGKALCKYFDKSNKEEVEGKFLTTPRTRAQWEEWAISAEAVQAALLGLEAQSEPLVKELIKALTSSTAPTVGAERVRTAISTINEALMVKATELKSKAKAKK